MLRLRAGSATLLIAPRSSAGIDRSRYCLDSEDDIRQRLTLALADAGAREAMRRFWANWQSDARMASVNDQSIVDRIALMSIRGPLIAVLIVDTSLVRHNEGAAYKGAPTAVHPRAIAKAKAVIASLPKTSTGRTPFPLTRASVPKGQPVFAAIPVSQQPIPERVFHILVLAIHSPNLPAQAKNQLIATGTDPTTWALTFAPLLLAWFALHLAGVGFVLDGLILAATAGLGLAGGYFGIKLIFAAVDLIGKLIVATEQARTEDDLRAAAEILVEIIVLIGVTALLVALTHATTRAISPAKTTSSIRRPPPERIAPVERFTERPKSENTRSEIPEKSTKAKLDEIYEAAPAAKSEIDAMADSIATKSGGRVSKVPLKSKTRALEKANNDYGGDATRVTDIARNTIVVPKEKIPDVLAALREQGAKVKEISPENDEFGYSGANSKIQTSVGIQGEIQVNSPEMIFAKEKPEIAQEILGQEQYDAIAEKAGVVGGKGHEFYERARTLPLDSAERAKLAEQSRAYYDKFR